MEVIGDRESIERNGELADALIVLRKAGKRHDDYRIEVRRLPDKRRPGSTVVISTYHVVVTNLKTSEVAQFDGGHRNAWVGDLERSLRPDEPASVMRRI